MRRCPKCAVDAPAEAYLERYLCRHCERVLPVDPAMTHFEAFGFDAPACDPELLRERHLELSRRFHPDRFTLSDEEERAAVLINSSAINDAYRCLKDTRTRARYWLDLCGEALNKDNNRVDPELVEELFDVQDLMAEFRSGHGDVARALADRLGAIRDDLAARVATENAAIDELMQRWPGKPEQQAEALASVKEALTRASYLETSLRDVGAALETRWQESVA